MATNISTHLCSGFRFQKLIFVWDKCHVMSSHTIYFHFSNCTGDLFSSLSEIKILIYSLWKTQSHERLNIMTACLSQILSKWRFHFSVDGSLIYSTFKKRFPIKTMALFQYQVSCIARRNFSHSTLLYTLFQRTCRNAFWDYNFHERCIQCFLFKFD